MAFDLNFIFPIFHFNKVKLLHSTVAVRPSAHGVREVDAVKIDFFHLVLT
jgi:hypothetical protein